MSTSKPSTPSSAPKARLSPTSRLKAQLAEEAAKVARLESTLQQLQAVQAERDRNERVQAEETDGLREKLRFAIEALRPFHEQTKAWDGKWPPDKIAVTQRLTFGALRTAKETFLSLTK